MTETSTTWGGRCAESLTSEQAGAFLAAVGGGLASEQAPVAAGALQCVHALLQELRTTVLQPHVQTLYTGIFPVSAPLSPFSWHTHT